MKTLKLLTAVTIFLLSTVTTVTAQSLPGATDPAGDRINYAAASRGTTIGKGGAPLSTFNFLIDEERTPSAKNTSVGIEAEEAFELDLGASRLVHSLEFHLYDGDPRFFQYRVEHSLDGILYEVLIDRTDGEHRGVQRITFEPISIRYLKIVGTKSSIDDRFVLTDEILLLGDTQAEEIFQTTQVTVDAISDAGTSHTAGKTLSLNAGIYRIRYLSGAISYWKADSDNNGRSWSATPEVSVPTFGKQYRMNRVHSKLSFFPTPEEASAYGQSQTITVMIPAHADVAFWISDSSTNDNRGSLTLEIEQLSGPNDSLLEQVRDSMVRSVLWEQRAVSNWQKWLTTNNRNCYGCHIQTQAFYGLRESKKKLPELPVDPALEAEFVDAFLRWQSDSGAILVNNHPITQTVLWVWAVSNAKESDSEHLRLPLVQETLEWLLTRQRESGSWANDHGHSSSILLFSGKTESASHTASMIQSIAHSLKSIKDGEEIPEVDAITERFEDALLKAAGRLYDPTWPYDQTPRHAAQTILGLKAASEFLSEENRAKAQTRLNEARDYLRSTQHPDGGWGDTSDDLSKPFRTAQALKALLDIAENRLDAHLEAGSRYLLRTQHPDGSWSSPDLGSRLATTTWIQIALPTIFDVLKEEEERQAINDLTAVGEVTTTDLFWSPIPEATGYNIYRRIAGTPFTRIATKHETDVATYKDTRTRSLKPRTTT